MNIKTEYYPKPIPDRRFDWDAWVIDADEDSPIGHGETKEDAIEDLKQKIEFNNN
jgi:predicted RNase H-like HicB family nuclease